MITCSLADIPAAISVAWEYPATTTAADFTENDAAGTHSGTSQTATLTIPSAKLLALHTAGSTPVDFKCKILVGTTPTEVTATQTISIYNPSENIIFQIPIFQTRPFFKHNLRAKSIYKSTRRPEGRSGWVMFPLSTFLAFLAFWT